MIAAAGFALLAASVASAADKGAPQLMVVGTVHFGNPGLDAVNVKVEDVLAPDRQQEIVRLVDALARFKPSHVAVEWDVGEQDKLDKAYADWRGGKRDVRDETRQIGFRLAEKLGLARVDAVDWYRDPPGKDEDYDYPAWAKANGRGAEMDAMFAPLQADADAMQKAMPCTTVSQWLAMVNSPDEQRRNALSYYNLIKIGDAKAAPGTNWVGTWHARNLKILTNLLALGAKPGERVVTVFGAGHRPLLEQYARESGFFEVVDPLKWLPKDRRRCL